MTEGLELAKDGIILLAGGGAVWKAISAIIAKLTSGTKTAQTVTVNAANNGNGNNGRSYATAEALSTHALTCAGAIHEKINKNYTVLTESINGNHRESMKAFADMRVSITKLESMRRGKD